MSATLRVSGPGIGWTVRDPRELALRIRLRAVRMVAPQGFGYLGQALSSAEQVAAVFACARPGLDRLVCSPGHYIIGPFAAAAELGLLAEDALAGALAAAGSQGRPSVLVCRTSTRHGLDCLPPDADGHFIKLTPDLARTAAEELTGQLEALRA